MRIDQTISGIVIVAVSIILIISLIQVKADNDLKSTALCDAIANDPDAQMLQCPAHESNISWVFNLTFAFSFLLVVFGASLIILDRVNLGRKRFKKVNTARLSDDEKSIYQLLKDNEGSMYQSDLVKNTDFSTVKITRVLDSLEQQDIAERKRRGMTNLVVLK